MASPTPPDAPEADIWGEPVPATPGGRMPYRETLILTLGEEATRAIQALARSSGRTYMDIAYAAFREYLEPAKRPKGGHAIVPPHPRLPYTLPQGERLALAVERIYAMLIAADCHEEAARMWRILANEANPRLLYVANERRWVAGDLVVHSADAKDREMLMRVVGYNPVDGRCQTVYERDAARKKHPTVWENDPSRLLDPRDFGIDPAEEG